MPEENIFPKVTLINSNVMAFRIYDRYVNETAMYGVTWNANESLGDKATALVNFNILSSQSLFYQNGEWMAVLKIWVQICFRLVLGDTLIIQYLYLGMNFLESLWSIRISKSNLYNLIHY